MVRSKKNNGFTIVELLIVIVVIAILAAITVVAYNGIQQRAKNTARITAAKQTIKVVKMYGEIADGTQLLNNIPEDRGVCYASNLPDVDGDGNGDCLYVGTTPYRSENSAVNSLLLAVGANTMPNYPDLPISGGVMSAPTIDNYPSVIDGRSASLQVRFYLAGEDQDCGVPVLSPGSGSDDYTQGDAKNSASSGGTTACVVDVSASE